jgi:uncharacterized protein with von Willebrand factor type A (vWA) domain
MPSGEAGSAGGTGALARNILYFARALREAGVPVGPGAVLDAIAAVEAVGVGDRDDFRETLHAVFIKTHEHTLLFDQAFDIFWRRKGFLDKLVAMMSPQARPDRPEARKPEPGAARIADALFKPAGEAAAPPPAIELDARFTMSADEILRAKDFAQMSAAEIAEAKARIARLALPEESLRMRRFVADPAGGRIDPRRSFRRSLKGGGAIDLTFRAPAERRSPVVALCDISGSMAEYSRLFLHFLHALGRTRRVSTFLFGTRLTNVTRAMRSRDPDEALERCAAEVADWSGGTRIGASLLRFNREWSRRVLGQGAIVILFTDGLERDGVEALAPQMERLRLSARRLVWVNPLLRYDEFAARARGVRAMLPYVDEFRPIHNLASMETLCRALSRESAGDADPKTWLRRSA